MELLFFLEVCPPPLVTFFDDDFPDTLSLSPFFNFYLFPYFLVFSDIVNATCRVMNLQMISESKYISTSHFTAVYSADLVMFWPFSIFDLMSSCSLIRYCCMNSPHPKTNMTSRVVFSFMYRAASIKASG